MSTFGEVADGENVSDLERGLVTAVDELASIHALRSDEHLLHRLVLVGVAEHDGGERSATARVVDDALHNTLDVAVAFGIVKRAELGRALAVGDVRVEHAVGTLTLRCGNQEKEGNAVGKKLRYRM